MLFKYVAIESVNAQREGTVDASTVDSAIAAVQKRGYTVISIEAIEEKRASLILSLTYFREFPIKKL